MPIRRRSFRRRRLGRGRSRRRIGGFKRKRGAFRMRRGGFKRRVQNIVMDSLTSDNSINDNRISAAVGNQGQQLIVTPGNGGTSVGLDPALEVMHSPHTLSVVLATITNTASAEFTVKSYALNFFAKNTSNADLYLTRTVWRARKDVPLSVAATLNALITASFGAASAIAAPYTGGNAATNVGATLFQAPGWTTWFKAVKVKGYHMKGGQEIRWSRVSRKNRRFTQAQLRPGGTIRELLLRGSVFDTLTVRGGVVADPARANPTWDSPAIITGVTMRCHYTWINDVSVAAGTTQARIGAAAANPQVIPENNPGAPIAEADI